MKRVKKIVALLLAMMMVMSVTACSSNSEDKSSSTSTKEDASSSEQSGEKLESAKERKPYTISMYFVMHESTSLEDIPESGYYLDNMYEEKFNVDFDIQYIPKTNEGEVFNITMASGDIPDIVTGSFSKLHKYKDAWWDLNKFIKGKYENLEKYFYDDPYVYALSAEDNGEIKILNMLSQQYLGDVLMARGDLIEKWGIDMSKVKTKEDWYELLKFVKEKDSSVVPYMTRKKTEGVIKRLCEGWSGIRRYEFVDTDNVVKYGAADPRMKEVVEWLRKLYAEGLIDQEYPTTDTAAWQEKLLGEGIFLTSDNASSRMNWALAQWETLGVTDKYYTAVPPIQPDENTPGFTTIHYPKLRGGFAIYRGAEEGKVDRILEMVNYNFSPEGDLLVNHGIEGISFEYGPNGEIIDIPEYKEAIDKKTMAPEDQIRGTFTNQVRLEPNYVQSTSNQNNEEVVKAAKMYEDGGLIQRDWLRIVRFTDEEQDEVTRLNADIKTYTDENIDKFITGTTSMDEWDNFVAGYEKLNLKRYMELYNKAFKRSWDLLGNK